MIRRLCHLSVVLTIVVFVASDARAGNSYSEGTSGDLSNDTANPTLFTLSFANNFDNLLTASMGVNDSGVPDLDYVHIFLTTDMALSAIKLTQYSSDFDGTAFIAVQSGSTFTLPPNIDFSQVGGLLGWAHFGPGEGDSIGGDILPKIGMGIGAMDFTPPLTGHDYTFWIQQLGGHTNYQLDFVVVGTPEPSSVLLACAGVAVAALVRRTRS